MNYLGIDVSKSTSRYVLLDNDGEQSTKPFTLNNDNQGFEKLLARMTELSLTPDNVLVGIEATGIWWENLYCLLTEKKFKVIVLNPHQTNKFREALRFKAKTDDIDAYVIAGLLRSGKYACSYIPEENIQVLREITKLRFQLVKDRQNYERQVCALLGLLFPEYEKTAIKNPFSVASVAILKAYPTAKHLAEAKPKHIEKIVRSIKGNNFNIDEIQSLIATAKNSIFSGRAKDARGMN
ncbi:MAG: IS110 family transposase, partial [Candidatus Omnitrophica bacterium]|nr:IS110 family transposase [Candidatus Omnitrophota bacterium]